MKHYAIITYGCQMNDHDSELMEGLLSRMGMSRCESEREADVAVFNTCCVREGAETRALARAQALVSSKRERPDMVIAIAGCVAQEKGERLLELLPHVDLVVGTRDYPRLPELVERVRASGERLVAIDSIDNPLTVQSPAVRRSALRANVNIMYGCNNSCTFCIVPKTRGPEWSRPLAQIVAEVRALVADGCREALLLGQNVNSYRDPEQHDFADLLHALDEVEGLWRIRYTSPNPKDARDRHISAIAACPKVMESLHLPVQSGSDRVLREMKRSYNTKRFRQIVERYRAENPVCALTTDVIVGFPTETEEDFQATMALFEEVRFDSAYMFHYSPRPGTASAETLRDDVPHHVKLERLRRLIDRQNAIGEEINQGEVGRVHEVLVEGPSRLGGGQLAGRTRTDKTVVFDGPERLAGTLTPVRIVRAAPFTLFGEAATREPAELAGAWS
ncbi:MAG: tRNA (N6-isopentenyl adenosine(37)-C2)-methylthiotransferase MiaB [Candidatus Sumerlaeia bacterium]|nr:tRNA (N6-isopentenyl adenosine(37)-C2)-methylthiotransferase MiaB [Candidatus Sumerlaeia bacterium]